MISSSYAGLFCRRLFDYYPHRLDCCYHCIHRGSLRQAPTDHIQNYHKSTVSVSSIKNETLNKILLTVKTPEFLSDWCHMYKWSLQINAVKTNMVHFSALPCPALPCPALQSPTGQSRSCR